VLVAKQEIARGTLFDQALADNLFVSKRIPRDSIPPNAIAPAKDEELLATYRGKVAGSDIFTGVPLVSENFVQASQLISTVAGAIPKGKQAITVSLDQTHAVGGFVTPGDKVNIILHFSPTETNATAQRKITAFLLPGLKVLAVGSSTVLPNSSSASSGSSTGETTTTTPTQQPSSLITLQVTPRQAEQIIQGTELGTVWLSLNPPDFDPSRFKTPAEIVNEINLFNQPLAEAQKQGGFVQDLPTPAEATP
jgi:pilus assembly protein CpaB